MDAAIRRAIARVDVVQAGQVISRGTASLVGPDLVLTALHVVGDRKTNPPTLYPGTITLTFPGHVTEVVRDDVQWNPSADWAVLRCATPPPDARPIPLADAPPDGAPWETYGFPDANPRDGLVQTGTVTNGSAQLDGVAAFQLFSQEAAAGTGAPVKGASGGPVLVDNALVAVLRFALMREGQTVAGTLYGCPVDLVLAGVGDRLPIPDPCRGLPGLPRHPLPPAPYRYLQHFTDADAEIFFGRSRAIRNVYQQVVAAEGAGIILLHGQSGVGKSSFLDAGLLPRLHWTHEVSYVRRDRARGLTGTLTDALTRMLGAAPATDGDTTVEPPADADRLRTLWHSIEAMRGRPLVAIVDQVEEALTLPRDEQHELAAFIEVVSGLFGDSGRPRGRLILGFRKEWFPEVQKELEERRVDYGKVFLERVDRDEVVDIVRGVTSTRRLRERYGVTIDPKLADIIATDLTADRDSPIAPTLEILLSKMWTAASAENGHAPAFTEELYRKLRSDGFLLGDFLDQQLASLAQTADATLVNTGLALDVLAFHTTPLLTAEQRTGDELRTAYRHRLDALPSLVDSMKRLYLLSDPSGDRTGQTATRLAHDTLAPVVRRRFDGSMLPAQRAHRIINSRHADWTDGRTDAPLDATDLGLVEAGLPGMRALVPDEVRLVEASRAERVREQQMHRRRRFAIALAAGAVAVAAGIAGWLAVLNRYDRRFQDLLALDARVPGLVKMQPVAGLITAIEAVDQSLTLNGDTLIPSIQENLAGALDVARERFMWPLDNTATTIAFSTDGRVAAGTADGTVQVFRLDGGAAIPAIRAAGSAIAVKGVDFSDDGTLLAAALGRQGVGVWDKDGHLLPTLPQLPDGIATAISFAPGGHTLVAAFTSSNNITTLYVCDLDKQAPQHLPIETRGPILSLETARTSTGALLIATAGGDVRLWDASGRRLLGPLEARQGSTIDSVDLIITPAPDRHVLLAGGSSDGTVNVWDATAQDTESKPFGGGEPVLSVAFGRDGRFVIAGGSDGYVRTYNLEGKDIAAPFVTATAGGVAALAVSPDAQYVAVGGSELGGRYLRIIDTVNLEVHFPLRRPTQTAPNAGTRINAMTFTASGDLLVGGLGSELARWTITVPGGSAWSQTRLTVSDTEQEEIISLAADAAGRVLVLVGTDGLQFRDAKGQLQARQGLPELGRAVAISPDGGTAVAGDDGGNVTIWDVAAHRLLQTVKAHQGTVWTVAFDPNHDRFATGGADGVLQIWRPDGTSQARIPPAAGVEITAAVFHPTDGTVFVGTNQGRVERHRDGGQLQSSVTVFREGSITSLAIDPRGETLFVASGEGVQWLNLATNGVLAVQGLGQDQPIHALAISRDGRLLAGAAADGAVHLWRAGWRDWLAEACGRLRGHDVFVSLQDPSRPHPDTCDVPGVNCRTAYDACLQRVWNGPISR